MSKTRAIIRSCNLGCTVLALVVNITPPLFIPLRNAFGLTYEQLGRLIMANFATQVTFDLICGAIIDRIPPRVFTISANILAFTGLWIISLAQTLFPAEPYNGILLGTIISAMGGGILELTLSPIVNATPSQKKTADMNMLHAYYAIGQLVIVAITALTVYRHPDRWPWIIRCWSLLPLLCALSFATLSIPKFVPEASRQKLRHIIRNPYLIIAIIAIGLCGGSELVMAQWTSTFAEKGLGLPKITGDLIGCCLFAAMMGIGRLWMGFNGERVDLGRMLLGCATLLSAAYLVASLAPHPAISLAACAIGGLGASLLWPGVLVLSARRFPLAGGSMFAALAASGDVGGAIIPWAFGGIADLTSSSRPLLQWFANHNFTLTPDQIGLRGAFLIAAICPISVVILLKILRSKKLNPLKP